MVPYLKYFFAVRGRQIILDSVSCRGDEKPTEPPDFVKWAEPDDLLPPDPAVVSEILQHSNEVFAAFSAPRPIGPNLRAAVLEKYPNFFSKV